MTNAETQIRYFTNRYPGRCNTCGAAVAAQAGFTGKENGRYTVYCRQHVPARIEASAPRVMRADGTVRTPYEPQNLDLLRALPGAMFDREQKCWKFSLAAGDRARVLEIADRLGLEVEPVLRQVEQAEQTKKAAAIGLYPFQVIGVDFLAKKPRALLGDDMGLGKTVQALAALPARAPALVVCPAAVKFNWAAEAAKWRPDYRVFVAVGRDGFHWPAPGEIVIVNFDILPALPDTGKYMAPAHLLVIVDEAHRVKNYKAARSKKVAALTAASEQCWGLTGTPLLNRPGDLFGVLAALGLAREAFGGWGKYCRLFDAHYNEWGGLEWGMPAPQVPEMLRRVMLRRRKDDVLPDLPKKTVTTLAVNGLGAGLTRRLDQLQEEWGDVLAAGELPPFEEFSAARAELAAARIPMMLDYVEDHEDAGVPLVVASAHLAPIEALKGRDGWGIITGATPAAARQEVMRAFQAGELKGVGLTIQAGGVGITLTKAWKMLFVDLDWVPANNAQCEDRIRRIGQTKPVEIVRMVSNHPLDQHILGLLAEKIAMVDAAVEAEVEGTKPAPVTGETEEEFAARMDAARAETARRAEAKAAEDRAAMAGRAGALHDRQMARANRPLLPLTPERVEAVRNAFHYMLSVCDGAQLRDGCGFNKPDAVVAHWVLRYGLDDEQEVQTAYAMLTHYHRQLKGGYPLLFGE